MADHLTGQIGSPPPPPPLLAQIYEEAKPRRMLEKRITEGNTAVMEWEGGASRSTVSLLSSPRRST